MNTISPPQKRDPGNGQTSVTEIKASHAVYISHAGEVANVVQKAAEVKVLETA